MCGGETFSRFSCGDRAPGGALCIVVCNACAESGLRGGNSAGERRVVDEQRRIAVAQEPEIVPEGIVINSVPIFADVGRNQQQQGRFGLVEIGDDRPHDAPAVAQPSASVETLARKYADRDGALVMRLDSTMVGLVKLRVAALPDSLRRSAALLDKVSGMTNIMLMTGLARTLDLAADTTAFVRLESDFRADMAALTAEPVRRRLFREREAGVEVAGYYSAAPSGEAELVLVVSGGGNEALCVLGGRFGEEEALRLATMQREQLLGRGGTR